MDAHGNELIGFGMLVAERLDFFDEVRRYAVDAEGNQLFQIDMVVAILFQLLDEFRLNNLHPHGL